MSRCLIWWRALAHVAMAAAALRAHAPALRKPQAGAAPLHRGAGGGSCRCAGRGSGVRDPSPGSTTRGSASPGIPLGTVTADGGLFPGRTGADVPGTGPRLLRGHLAPPSRPRSHLPGPVISEGLWQSPGAGRGSCLCPPLPALMGTAGRLGRTPQQKGLGLQPWPVTASSQASRSALRTPGFSAQPCSRHCLGSHLAQSGLITPPHPPSCHSLGVSGSMGGWVG